MTTLTLSRSPALQAQIDALFSKGDGPLPRAHVHSEAAVVSDAAVNPDLAPSWDSIVGRYPGARRYRHLFDIEPVQTCPGKLTLKNLNQRMRLDLITLDLEPLA